MNNEEMNKKMSQVIAKAWSDADFKAKLLANPADILKAEGIEVPPNVSIKAVENTKDVQYIVIPNPPEELSEEELDNIAGGFSSEVFTQPSAYY